MDALKQLLTIGFGAIFVYNFVLALFLGLCPFIGVSKKMSSAIGMGLAVTFVMTMASVVTFLANLVLVELGLEVSLQIVVFILVIASFVQFVEMVIQKVSPALYQALGIFLPLITTNCAVLGVTQLNIGNFKPEIMGTGMSFLASAVHGFCGGLGFMLAMILMSAMREELEFLPVPKAFRGVPIAFLLTGALALAFFGFGGMV
jgi:electron transport complex protein RnfA